MDIYQKIEAVTAEKHGAVANLSKKSLGDFLLENDPKRPVNVKSNNVEKSNYSPNVISAKRLIEWLKIEGNELYFIFVDYKNVENVPVIVNESGLVPFYQISWDCLTIEAQGWGVIQMCKPLLVNKEQTKKEFFSGMKIAYEKFIRKEARKAEIIIEMIKDF